ncbi:MAG: DNA repair protein RecO [Thermodesulfobacteriota bacterium]
MSRFSAPAILLRRIAHGDHDLILTLLTRDQGKIAVIAKNAKKSTRRFAGALEPFSVVQAVCEKGRGGLMVLQEAALIRPNDRIRGDIRKTAYANFWAETIHVWVEEGRSQEALFDLLRTALELVNGETLPAEVVSIYFQIRFLSLSGLLPNLVECCACRCMLENIGDSRMFPDFRKGGVTCRNCGPENEGGTSLSKGTMKKLLWINSPDVKKVERIRFAPQGIREGLFFLETFVVYHLGKELNSLKFLRSMRKP